MNTMKKLGLVACAAMTLMAQAALAEPVQRTDSDFLTGLQEEFGYGPFTDDLGVFCYANPPVSAAWPFAWVCTGGVDGGIVVRNAEDS